MNGNALNISAQNGGDALLSKSEVAIFLGVSTASLDRWDAILTGPPRMIVGRQVRYRRSTLLSWLEAKEAK